MKSVLVASLLLVGGVFLFLGALGVVRLPDVYLRLQAATKAATLGLSSLLLAVAVAFADPGTVLTALATVAFFFLTVPIAAHVIGRAAYYAGVPLWEGTHHDELGGDAAARSKGSSTASPGEDSAAG